MRSTTQHFPSRFPHGIMWGPQGPHRCCFDYSKMKWVVIYSARLIHWYLARTAQISCNGLKGTHSSYDYYRLHPTRRDTGQTKRCTCETGTALILVPLLCLLQLQVQMVGVLMPGSGWVLPRRAWSKQLPLRREPDLVPFSRATVFRAKGKFIPWHLQQMCMCLSVCEVIMSQRRSHEKFILIITA